MSRLHCLSFFLSLSVWGSCSVQEGWGRLLHVCAQGSVVSCSVHVPRLHISLPNSTLIPEKSSISALVLSVGLIGPLPATVLYSTSTATVGYTVSVCLKCVCVCLLGAPPDSQLSTPASPASPTQDIWVLRSSPTGKGVWSRTPPPPLRLCVNLQTTSPRSHSDQLCLFKEAYSHLYPFISQRLDLTMPLCKSPAPPLPPAPQIIQ